MRREEGFSLVETLIATGVMLLVTASIFTMMHPVLGAFAAEPEVADMQQRLRVGADTLSKDLMMAGAGADRGAHAGTLAHYFPSVLPLRRGSVNDDPPGTFASDRITIVYVPPTAAQTTLGTALSGTTGAFTPAVESDCPADPATGEAAKLCGFADGRTVLVYDDGGSYNLFTITKAVDGSATLTLTTPGDAGTATFAVGSKIVESSSHTYYLKTDVPNDRYQLMHYDGTGNSVPVVDNVVGLRFDYYGDAQPTTANCLFSPGAIPAPELPALDAGKQILVALTAAELTDGPFCPDNINGNRWDADLLRIRRIGVTLRVQTPVAALRGPAGPLFTRGGTSKGGFKWVPDQEIRFDISPRNLNLDR